MDILFWLYDLFNGGPLTPLNGSLSGSLQASAASLEGFAGSLGSFSGS
ncbi:hypothetical protein [Prescottella equi]|jgi:hypothetical protein|nr:hypothetical protein [Prescottella equi]NKV32901.1 hypothetical protein [Prescottella equi]PTR21190.1 hypothetical protein C8K36_11620 [Rhodococcus sp. OK519]BCN52137.1 hypothetical protein RE9425_05270 [Prescottella equi]